MENNPSQAATGSIDICNEFEQSTVDQSSHDDTFPLDSGTSKIGQSSITQTPQHATPSTSTRKRSVRKLSISIPDELPLNDDESELINEDATAKMKGQEETPQSCNDTGPVRMIATMEQMQEHMSRCLELSTENKINTKNAFGLKLIDYMSIMTKGGEQNFTTMACQLDAGAKIYANRVDAVHNLTLKLAETCFFAERQTSNQTPKEDDEMNVTVDGIEAGTSGTTEKVKKKKAKKSVIATAEQITRKIKGKDPRERFVKLEARPGDILTKAKRDPKDLSLTLDKHVPFWMDWQKYTPTKATGTCEVPTICNENREFGSSQDSAISEPSVSDLLSGLNLDDQDSDAEPDSPVDFDNEDNNTPTIVDSSLVEKPKCGESEAVLCAGREVIKENADAFNFEALKTALHESGDNEYNYLKTDVSHFRTGPNFQKCFPGLKCAANKKKGIRKKKELCDINYEKLPANRNIVKTKKRRTVLAKSTVINWSKKNSTLYSDFDMNIRPLCTLFHMDIAAIIVRDPPEQDKMDSNPEILAALDTEPDVDPSDEHNTSGNDHNSQCDDNNAQANNNEDEFEAQVDFSLPLGSNQEFGVFPSSSSDDPYSGELPTASSPASNDAFEGDNLVPMVKMVKVDPIRCVAKPNRVDMQHLKTIMLNIILQGLDGDNENQHPSEGNVAGRQSVWFKDVIYKLFNTDVLHYRTRRDLSVAMAYLALLTLASENEFMLENRDGDVMISHYQVPCNPETENQGTMD